MTFTIPEEYNFYGLVIFCIMIWLLLNYYWSCFSPHCYKEEDIEHPCTQTTGHLLFIVFPGHISIGESGNKTVLTLSEILIHGAQKKSTWCPNNVFIYQEKQSDFIVKASRLWSFDLFFFETFNQMSYDRRNVKWRMLL